MRAQARLLLPLAFVVSMALAPATEAATPFTAGTGSGHDIAVGTDGVAHVAWFTNEADDRIGYCRVPAGGSACDSESGFLTFPDINATAQAQGSVQIFAPEANTVVIFASCTQCPTGDPSTNTYRRISTDNGANFDSVNTIVGELGFSGQSSYLGGGNVLGVSASRIQGMPTVVAPVTLGGASFTFSASAVKVPSLNEAVYAVNNLSAVNYRVFNAASTTPATLNVAGNWAAAQALTSPEADNEETHLSAGGNGVLLTYASTFSPGDIRVGFRRYNATMNTFTAPVYIDGPSSIDNNALDFPHHSQDGGNRIHVVWRTLHSGGRLRYTRSTNGGTTFAAPANLALGEPFQDPLVEAGPAGTGFVAWRTTGSAIRVVRIDPLPEPSGPGGPGPGGPGPDTTRPTAGGFDMGDSSLTPGQGTRFTFNSSEAGLATLTVHKQVKGLKVRQRGRRRCLPATPRRLRALRRRAGSQRAFRRLRRQRRCKAYKRIGRIRQAVTPGRNTIVFSGRIAGRRLRPGRYRAQLVIRDSAGNLSRVETVRFRVLRRRR